MADNEYLQKITNLYIIYKIHIHQTLTTRVSFCWAQEFWVQASMSMPGSFRSHSLSRITSISQQLRVGLTNEGMVPAIGGTMTEITWIFGRPGPQNLDFSMLNLKTQICHTFFSNFGIDTWPAWPPGWHFVNCWGWRGHGLPARRRLEINWDSHQLSEWIWNHCAGKIIRSKTGWSILSVVKHPCQPPENVRSASTWSAFQGEFRGPSVWRSR